MKHIIAKRTVSRVETYHIDLSEHFNPQTIAHMTAEQIDEFVAEYCKAVRPQTRSKGEAVTGWEWMQSES